MTAPACKVVFVLGPTATGKTRLGVRLARRFAGEILSLDSRQVYRGLDLGTGKDLAEYGHGPDAVRYHLIDLVEPTETYSLFRFVADARHALATVTAAGRLPILVGGTPLFANALLDEYRLEGGPPDPAFRAELAALTDADLAERLRSSDPERFARTDTSQRPRLVRALEIAHTRTLAPTLGGGAPLNALLLGVYLPRAEVHRRIAARLDARLNLGLIEEVERLHRQGLTWARLEYLGLEYRCIAEFLQGKRTRDGMREALLAGIRRFAKSQDIWFRKMEREGKVIHWIPGGDPATAEMLVQRFLDGAELPAPTIRLCEIFYGPRSQHSVAAPGAGAVD